MVLGEFWVFLRVFEWNRTYRVASRGPGSRNAVTSRLEPVLVVLCEFLVFLGEFERNRTYRVASASGEIGWFWGFGAFEAARRLIAAFSRT